MPKTLTYCFTLQSPWSYLGHAEAMRLCHAHGLEVRWAPMNLAAVFPESGGLPLAKRHPKRQAYRDIELQRWREQRALPLNLRPAFWPLASTLPDRCVVELARSGADPDRFVAAAFSAVWAEDADLADEAVLARLLDDAGHPSAVVIEAAASPEVEALYLANARHALDAGVFGAPTYILDGEPFWGQDRLTLLEAALASGRAPYRAETAAGSP